LTEVPEEWINYIFRRRREMIIKISRGEAKREEILLEFTRALPAIVTDGPAGLNASIKMVGVLPKEKYIPGLLSMINDLINKKPKTEKIIKFLLEKVYVEDILDFTKLFTLDLARKNTWKNINETKKAVLIFFTPPIKSYMIKADVTIHVNDEIFQLANAMHDLYHVVPKTGKIVSKNPAYVFHIREIWDKSADKFGVKIFPLE